MVDNFRFRYSKRWKVVTRAVSNTKVSTLQNAHPCPGDTVQSALCLHLEMCLQKAGKCVLGSFPQEVRVPLDAVISCQPSPCLVAGPEEKSTPRNKKLLITPWSPQCCHTVWARGTFPSRTHVPQIKLGHLSLRHTSSSSQGKCWSSAPSL